jgi:hypothetical protein
MDAHSACHQPWACALRRKNPVQGTLSSSSTGTCRCLYEVPAK